MENSLYDTLLQNGTVKVKSPRTGLVFDIETGVKYGLRYYTAKVNGRAVKGHNKMLLDKERAQDWLAHVTEVEIG